MRFNLFLTALTIGVAYLGNTQTKYDNHLIEITTVKDSSTLKFVKTPDLFEERWDTLAQPNFWKVVMRTPPDSCVLNVMRTREILEMQSVAEWNKQTEDEKDSYRDSLRVWHGLEPGERIFMTTGKSDFFQFDLVFPSINRGIEVFAENETDPWYAQAILMIESPGKIAYSNAGALGPFQLMKSVARNHGLRVDSKVDERKDFDKSAKASAHLIRTGCVPEGKRIMRKFGFDIYGDQEFDLWFRLLVLHIYHAGAGNVENVMTHVVKPTEAGGTVIQTIWQSEYGNFKNSSQNYSQLALAAMLVLDDLIYTKCSSICEY